MSDYLIIGGTGSLGKKLINRLLVDSTVSVYSRDEAKHWSIRQQLRSNENFNRLRLYVGDIRDKNRLRDVIITDKPKTILIASALKHVDTCEVSPNESVLTNLIGTQNVIDVVKELENNNIERVLFVSTDKACSPVNVYGMCKAVSERLITSQAHSYSGKIKFLVTRYGNVLESRGSIIPLFRYQAEFADCLTVTDPNMTRFVMTLDQSVDLILDALSNGASGETWIPKLPAMRIGDLAQIFADKFNKPIKIVGVRPGEKLHEDLVNESESYRTTECRDRQAERYVISSALEPAAKWNLPFTYSSNKGVLSCEELKIHLEKLGILDRPLDEFTGLNIEEIAK